MIKSFQQIFNVPWASGEEPACQGRRLGLDLWVGKIPWRKKWQPTPVFLPGKSHGQRSLEGHSPWGHKRVRHDLGTKEQQRVRYVPYTETSTLRVSALKAMGK